MPSGLNANYANWERFSIGYNMYDYFLKELMPLIYGWFPASDKREDNFIAGLSMGGTGTLVYALNHPERFAAAAVLSCCPFQMGFTNDANLDDRSRGMVENRGGLAAFQASYENTWGLVDKLVGSKDPARAGLLRPGRKGRGQSLLNKNKSRRKKRRPALRVCSEAPGARFFCVRLRGPRGPGRSRRPPRACGSSGAPSAAGPRPGTGG